MKKKILIYTLVTYTLITSPVISCFVLNEYFRFQFLQTISNWYNKLDKIDFVFIGDSITAGGRNWGSLIDKAPYRTINLAGNGYTTRQILYQVNKASNYNPKYLFVLAGTNDVFALKDSVYNIEQFKKDYKNLVEEINTLNCQAIFTLIPYQSSSKDKKLIDEMNTIIKQVLNKYEFHYIDLNPLISENGVLKKEFTVDGVHFSEKANIIWGKNLKNQLNESNK